MKTTLLCLVLIAPVAAAQQFSEWSTPVNLTDINSAADDQHPAISKDGLSLYFASNRPGGCGGFDIWVAQRASVDSPWEEPFNLGCTINSTVNDHAPNLTTDGHRLFFHSFRAGGCGGGDIYYADRKDRRDDLGWGTPVNLNRFGRDPETLQRMVEGQHLDTRRFLHGYEVPIEGQRNSLAAIAQVLGIKPAQ